MQYILTQEEYDELKRDRKHNFDLSNKKLQELCTKICNEMPLKYEWINQIFPWKCILTETENHYCDNCIVQDICPNEWKRFSP